MECSVAVLAGDGVGPEVVKAALQVLDAIKETYRHEFRVREDLVGGSALDAYGTPLRDETLSLCRECDAVLLGATGGPKWQDVEPERRPERGLLRLRKELGLYANLRPVRVLPMLAASSHMRADVVQNVDLVFVRELTGGIYFGQPSRRWVSGGVRSAVDTLEYSEPEIERILRVAFEVARMRKGKVTSVDKANVLQSSQLWREMADELSGDYPDVKLEHMLVDTCAMSLLQAPDQFDVVVTENMFGDILSDEASALTGSIGMLPSASLAGIPGRRAHGLYEPIHGSAPSLAGRDVANPLGAILSVAAMLRYSLALGQEADAIEQAVYAVLERGYRTQDLADGAGHKLVGTQSMGRLVSDAVRAIRGTYASG